MREWIGSAAIALVMVVWGSTLVLAQEYIGNEGPVPESVDQVVTPMEVTFQGKPEIPRFFPWLKEQLKDTPAFFRDTKLDLNLRTYYLYRDQYRRHQKRGLGLGRGSLVPVRLVS